MELRRPVSCSRRTALLSRPDGSGDPSYLTNFPASVIKSIAFSRPAGKDRGILARDGGSMMSTVERRRMVVSPVWLQATILTFVVGFAILGYLALRVYEDHPPLPARVVSEAGQTVFTSEDVLKGQQAFLTYGLM